MESQNMKEPKRLKGVIGIFANRYKNANIRKKLNIALITALLIPLLFSFVYAVIFFGNKIQEEATNKNDSDLSLAQLLYKNKVFEQVIKCRL